jgi:hypothetical protein
VLLVIVFLLCKPCDLKTIATLPVTGNSNCFSQTVRSFGKMSMLWVYFLSGRFFLSLLGSLASVLNLLDEGRRSGLRDFAREGENVE